MNTSDAVNAIPATGHLPVWVYLRTLYLLDREESTFIGIKNARVRARLEREVGFRLSAQLMHAIVTGYYDMTVLRRSEIQRFTEAQMLPKGPDFPVPLPTLIEKSSSKGFASILPTNSTSEPGGKN